MKKNYYQIICSNRLWKMSKMDKNDFFNLTKNNKILKTIFNIIYRLIEDIKIIKKDLTKL